MANEDHLRILRQGVEVWNAWREMNPDLLPDLRGAILSLIHIDPINSDLVVQDNPCLEGFNLSRVDLSGAKMSGTNLSNANLSHAQLNGSDLIGVNFSGTNLEAAILNGANVNASNLKDVNLRRAFMVGASFRKAFMVGANLEGSHLIRTELIAANLAHTNLTGACIEDWHLNGQTILEGIKCDYVFLENGRTDSCPSDPNRNFAPGEFTKLFQKAINTVDLIFDDGIDWAAFFQSLQELQSEHGEDNLAVQAIEKKLGSFIIRLEASPGLDKAAIERRAYEKYEFRLEAQEEKIKFLGEQRDFYREQVQLKQREGTDLLKNIGVLAEAQSKQSEALKAMSENPKVNQTFNIQAPVHGFSGYTETFNNFSPEQKQNLAEAAAEIQQLLTQLAQANPTSESAIVEAVHQEIKRNPTLKARLLGALKAGGLEALKAIFAHPVFTISAETVKGWLEAE